MRRPPRFGVSARASPGDKAEAGKAKAAPAPAVNRKAWRLDRLDIGKCHELVM
jgi:hypothetical protein